MPRLQGALPGETALTSMAFVLKPTAAQDAALTQLLADQANPASTSYHQWLTPAQYGARFGVADADLAILQSWLQSRGFTVNAVADSRNRINLLRHRIGGRERLWRDDEPLPARHADLL